MSICLLGEPTQGGHQERECEYLSHQGSPPDTTPGAGLIEATTVPPGVAPCKACASISNILENPGKQTIGISQANYKLTMGWVGGS